MNPNDNQSDFNPVGNVRNNYGVKKSGSKKSILFGLFGLVAIAAVVVTIVIIKKNEVPPIDFEEGNKITMYSERAAKVNPMNYILSEEDNDEAEQRAVELLDNEITNKDALLSYFKNKIQAELDKNNTDEALKLLWKERDILQERGYNSLIQKVLLEMDTSKLVNFQKIYLYRAIVTASAILGDEETMNKYAALVDELDDPSQYVVPSDNSINYIEDADAEGEGEE